MDRDFGDGLTRIPISTNLVQIPGHEGGDNRSMLRMATFCEEIQHLKDAGLRPTRQRLALSRLLFAHGDRHVTAEDLYQEARSAGIQVSLATIYNTLHQFTAAGLLREVPVDTGQSYFDTNTSHHHHFFDPSRGTVIDIPGDAVNFTALPEPPEGFAVDRVEVIVRLRPRAG
jgi:Fur family transcriptional regulator, iron response regulator